MDAVSVSCFRRFLSDQLKFQRISQLSGNVCIPQLSNSSSFLSGWLIFRLILCQLS